MTKEELKQFCEKAEIIRTNWKSIRQLKETISELENNDFLNRAVQIGLRSISFNGSTLTDLRIPIKLYRRFEFAVKAAIQEEINALEKELAQMSNNVECKAHSVDKVEDDFC